MIANITTGGFLKPLIDYNQKKVRQNVAETLDVKNIWNKSEKTAQAAFIQLTKESKRKHKFFHVSLNFPKQDSNLLNTKNLKQIAEDYMRNIGFPESHPFIVYKHNDTEHPHLHIVTSKILETGKPLPDGNIRYRSQRITRELENDYGLTKVNSIKEGKKQKSIGNGLNTQVLKAVDNIQKSYFPKDLKELNQYLNKVQLGLTVLPKEKDHLDNGQKYNIVYHRVGVDNKRLDKGIK